MDISRTTGTVLRLEPAIGPSAQVSGLPLGTPLAAVVDGPAGDGGWVIDVAGRQLVARTMMALAPGDRLDVVATRSGSSIELHVLQAAARFDDTQYAAATLAQNGARE